jgi:hypothetical protein
LGGGQAVDFWHADVHEDHVGPVGVGQRHRFGAVVSFGDHLDVGPAAEQDA